jgi:Dna[CI] antecedent, DciA
VSDLPRPIADALAGALPRGAPVSPELALIARRWPALAGETVAREAWPTAFGADGTLVVTCASATWASELALMGPLLRERLREHGWDPPPELRFRVGRVPAREASRAAAPAPPDEAAQQQARDLSGSVRDPRLRASLQRAIAGTLGRRRRRPPGPPDRPAC